MTTINQFIKNKQLTLKTVIDDLEAAMERRGMLDMLGTVDEILAKKENNLLIFRLKAHITSLEYTIETVDEWRIGAVKMLFSEEDDPIE